MRHAMKELLNVAFQGISRPGIILTFLAQGIGQIPDRQMSALAFPGRIGMVDEGGVEYFVQLFKNDMMCQPVLDIGLVDYPVLRVMDMELHIRPVPIGLASQLAVQLENIIL